MSGDSGFCSENKSSHKIEVVFNYKTTEKYIFFL